MQNEMSVPDQAARMKQGDDLFRDRIDPGEVRPFVTVAAVARPGKIIQYGLAAVLAGYNVFKVKGFKWWQGIRKAAILTAPAGALTNLLAERVAHLIRARPAFGARPSGAGWQ